MPRIACLLVPDLPLCAALRAEPELRGRPLAVVAQGQIVSGWFHGLTLEQARAIEPALVSRPLSPEGVRSTRQALLDVALSVTPRVEDAAPGRALLDLAGTRALFPSERGLATALETRLAGVGLESTRIGIGPGATVAELAARHRDGGYIVERADDFLGPLPLDLLDPPDEVFDRLTRWGIHTLGELAALPRAALGARLGEDGVRLARRARGHDLAPFRPTPPRLRFEEFAETGYPLDNLEALAFPLHGACDRLGRRLRVRGLAARELRIELRLESGREFARGVEFAAATTEARVLTSLVRLALEKDPPPEPVETLKLIASPGQLETAQLDLFMPPLPAPAELAITVARLEALCGSGRVGAPGVEDTHRPDAMRVDPFDAHQGKGVDPFDANQEKGVDPSDAQGSASAVRESDEPALAPAMALRAVRPPCPVRVRGELASVDGSPVLRRAGPWRLFGEWWGERCFARDYYDAELDDGRVCRLYRENDTWYLDGVYD